MSRRLLAITMFATLWTLAMVACQSSSEDPTTAPVSVVRSTPTASSESGDDTATRVPSPPALATSAGTQSATPMLASPALVTPTATTPAAPEGTTTVTLGDRSLAVPEGYTISIFAENLGAPRFMALDPNGVLYVTDKNGRVLRLPDANDDGVADSTDTVLDGLNTPHGITFYNGALYVAEETRVIKASDADGNGTYETVETLIDGLPQGGHSTRTIRFGPDGMLYVSIGSSCNVCEEEDRRRATIMRYNADGSGGEPFAIGLRNAVGITFDPDTGLLWATNNGRDGMGDDVPPETINQPRLGDDFGWPGCHAGEVIDPQFGDASACDGIAQPAVKMQAHSAPLGLTFVSGGQLSAYAGDLLVAFHGSWNRTTPTGFKVVRIPFENGAPTGQVEDFVTGWLLPSGDRWGRPVDVLIAPDGSLMISDDEGGRIFRLSRAS